MNEKTEPTTAELKRHLETIYEQNEYGIQNIIVGDSRYVQEVCGDALEVIEQQEWRIAELERELAAELQMRIDTHAELICAWGENSRLQKELAEAKAEFEIIRQDGICEVCKFGDNAPPNCREYCCFVWRGAREGEGKCHT